MKIFTNLFIFIFLGLTISAQQWRQYIPQDKLENGTITLTDYQEAFKRYSDSYYADRTGFYMKNGELIQLPGYKQFKRWEWFMMGEVEAGTKRFPQTDAWTEWEKYVQKYPSASRSVYGNWVNLGPNTVPPASNGLGRLNCVAFHPSDPDIFWVGAATGGIWKTIDHGSSWTCLSDNVEIMGIADIVIPDDYTTSHTIYIATGDRDEWRGSSVGVYKSVNEGLTWFPTDLQFDRWDWEYTSRLLKHPDDDNILYAATTDGVYKTTDGGVNFTKIAPERFIDMEFKPNSPDTLYGSTKNGFGITYSRIYRSVDGGDNWTQEWSNTDGNRVELAVSPDEPDFVYAVVADQDASLLGVYRSTNKGGSFALLLSGNTPGNNILGRSCTGDDDKGQGNYDLCIAVNPVDGDEVYIGGIYTWKSTDGGTTWNIINSGGGCGGTVDIVHVDKHNLAFQPGTLHLFECHDGGLHYSTDMGNSWTDLSNGLEIGQIYRIATAQTIPEEVITGYQDCGSKLLSGGSWQNVTGADGMHCIIDPTTYLTQYASTQNGSIHRTTDHWVNNTWITGNIPVTDTGDWVTPYMLHPNDHNTIYVGMGNLYKSTDKGDNFTIVYNFPDTLSPIRLMDIAPSNTDHLALATVKHLFVSTNAGATWTDVTANLPFIPNKWRLILDITYKNNDDDTFWITMGSYDEHGVYETTDHGATWTNISEGLPEVPARCIIQNTLVSSYTELYCATNMGVFLKIGGQPWLLFNNNLPKVCCSWLTIHYDGADSKLRCGTWGRGAWESDLFSTEAGMLCIWTGENSNNWWDANNWNFTSVPDVNSYVAIPAGCPNDPLVTGAWTEIKELTIYPGANLTIGNNILIVEENADIYGTLVITDNTGSLKVKKDLTWYTGSSADIQADNAIIIVERNWEFAGGSDVDLNNGYVYMSGGDYNSDIIINSPSCSFHHLVLDKSSFMIVTCSSSYSLNTMTVNGTFNILTNNYFIYDCPGNFVLNGSFINSGSFEFINGALKYAGGLSVLSGDPYCYFNDLILDGTASTYLTLDFNATIAGDLDIINGSLDPLTNDLYIYGNWNNQAGQDGFIQNTSNVIFKGADWQILSGTETFHRLTLHTTGPGISIQNGTIECEEYDWTSGTLEVTTGGTFIAQDLIDQGIKGNFNLTAGGNIELHSTTWIHLKGNVTISGGTFDVYGGIIYSSWPSGQDVSLTMSDGELNFHDNGIYIHDNNSYTVSVDMTGGTLGTGGMLTIETAEFDATEGAIELIGNNTASIAVDPGISLPELIINKSTAADHFPAQKLSTDKKTSQAAGTLTKQQKKVLPPSGTRSGSVTVGSDLDITGELIIETGEFDIGEYTVDVGGDVNIYSILAMNDPNGLLVANQDLFFYPGSDDNITDGDIHLYGGWLFYNGTNANFTGSHTVTAMGTGSQVLSSSESDAAMRTLVIANTSDVVEINTSNNAFRVNGNVVLNNNTELEIGDSLWVGSYFNTQPLATASIVSSGHLYCNYGLILGGTMDLSGGDVRVLQDFIYPSTGTLNIHGGIIYLDMPHTGTLIDFPGVTSISSGGLLVTNDGVLINGITSIINMSGGTLHVGQDLVALTPGAFHPTGGKVVMSGPLLGEIHLQNGNHFFDLIINKQPTNSYVSAVDSIRVEGDLRLGNGGLIMYGNPLIIGDDLQIDPDGWLSSGNNAHIEVAGDWTNDNGEDGFLEGTSSTVYFTGTSPSMINNTETFYNVIFDKTLGTGEYITLAIDDTLKSVNNLEIQNGALRLQEDCCIEANNLTIQAGAGLAVDTLEWNVNIYVSGDWDNHNTAYTANTGFNHGNSSVILTGNSDQSLISSAGEQFYELHLDKNSGYFEPECNLTFIGDCYVDDGAWSTGAGSMLIHTFYKDLEIANSAQWTDSTCRLKFVGEGGQWIKNYMYPTLTIWDLWVEQPLDPYSYLMMVGFIRCRNWAYIPSGELFLNGGTIHVDDRIQVNTNGKVAGFGNSTIRMADGATIFLNGGTLSLSGSEAVPCLISNQGSGYYYFNVVSGGYFSAYWTTVEYLKNTGVDFYNGGIADTNLGFQHCVFQNGIAGGTLLQFSTDQEVEFHNVQFPDTPVGGNYNVKKSNDAGNISFAPAFGPFAGEDYEDDPYGRVTWDLGGEWTGLVSTDWHTAGNWVNDLLPATNTDVLIPGNTPNNPTISTGHVQIESLIIESDAILSLASSYDLLVYQDVEIWGTLAFSGNEDFTVFGDMIYQPGSSVNASTTCDINIYGDMIIENGSNLNITGGYTNIRGSTPSHLICLEDSAAVFQLRIIQGSGVPFYFDASSTGDLFINATFYNLPGNIIYGDAPIKVYLNRSYLNTGGNLYCDSTHFIFRGFAGLSPFKMMPGDYLGDLTMASTTHLNVDDTYSDTLHIKGNLTINPGISGSSGIDANGAYMIIEGDWDNNVGWSAFAHGENVVEFKNAVDPLSIHGTNNFYGLYDNTSGTSSLNLYDYLEVERELEVDHYVSLYGELYLYHILDLSEPSANLVMASGSFAEVELLSQGGTITCNSGDLYIFDLRFDDLRGTYIINDGFVELQQDITQNIDLAADITMTDGYFYIYGGNLISKWPSQISGNNPVLNMSDGILYFASQGIEIENKLSDYNLTENITGGIIRTSKSFFCRGADTYFSPSGGIVELTGNTNTDCEMSDTGNAFWILKINKTSGATVKNVGTNIQNSLLIQSGRFDDKGNPVNIGP